MSVNMENYPQKKMIKTRPFENLHEHVLWFYRTYISAKWYGFDDPQSGLEKYVWRAGTTKGGSDIVSEIELHLTETAAIYNTTLGLPLNQRIYVTVRAYNKAGIYCVIKKYLRGWTGDGNPKIERERTNSWGVDMMSDGSKLGIKYLEILELINQRKKLRAKKDISVLDHYNHFIKYHPLVYNGNVILYTAFVIPINFPKFCTFYQSMLTV